MWRNVSVYSVCGYGCGWRCVNPGATVRRLHTYLLHRGLLGCLRWWYGRWGVLVVVAVLNGGSCVYSLTPFPF